MFDDKTLKALNGKYGKKNEDFLFNPNRILASTGSIVADVVIGQEGMLLKGRMTEVFGPESCVTADTMVEVRIDGVEKTIPIIELQGLLNGVEINTPDGWQPISRFQDKGFQHSIRVGFFRPDNREIIYITCSIMHRFLLSTGEWIEADLLTEGHFIQSKWGNLKFVARTDMGEQPVYDIEVLHPNHRYYTNGAVSHNSGKTTICYQSIASALQKGWVVAMFDNEQTFDVDYARALGVEIGENFQVFQPDDAEESEAILNDLIGIGKDGKPKPPLLPDLAAIIIDSITAWAPRKLMAIENSTGEGQTKGLHAAYWTNFSRKLQVAIKKRNIACLCTNQVRNKLQMGGSHQAQAMKDTGIGAGFSQDAGWTTTGGNALRFYMSVRTLMYQAKKLKETRIIRGVETDVDEAHWVEFKNVKNKVSAPFRKARLVLRYGVGTDDIPPMMEYLRLNGIISNAGANLMYSSSTGECDVKEFGAKKFDKAMRNEAVIEDMRKQYLKLKQEEDPYADDDEDIASFSDDEDGVDFDEEEIDFDEVQPETESEDTIRDWSLTDLKKLAKDDKIKIVGKVTKAKLLKKLLEIYD